MKSKVKEKYYKETEYHLYNYTMFKASIENMQQEVDYLKDECNNKALSYDGIMTSKTNKISSSTEDTALSNLEKIEYLERSIKRMQIKIEQVDRTMEGLTDTEKTVIETKYMKGKLWWKVASEVRYSERQCKRIRTDAIEKIAIGVFGERAIEEKGE